MQQNTWSFSVLQSIFCSLWFTVLQYPLPWHTLTLTHANKHVLFFHLLNALIKLSFMQCGCSIIQRLSCQVSLSRNARKNIKWASKWLWNSCGISVCFNCKRELANLFGALKKSGSGWVYYSVHVQGLYEILLVKQKENNNRKDFRFTTQCQHPLGK